MTAVTIEQAQSQLPALIAKLKPGDAILIMEDNRAVARLVAEPAEGPQLRQLGTGKGRLTILKEDDEHLDDFREYMW
ncbi:MAG: hypothetical protein KJZ87_12610 [Thermoguttaceae bacterium]|nr:hypothetical protein [Thermoguttaceae bacterium]